MWLTYKNVSNLPTDYDIYYGRGNTFPWPVQKSWKGFTITAGVAAYRATENTLNFMKDIETYVNNNFTAFNDQGIINELMCFGYKASWTDIPGSGCKETTVNMFNDKKLRLKLFDPRNVLRGGIVDDCRDPLTRPWIMSPKYHANWMEKSKMYIDFKACISNWKQSLAIKKITKWADGYREKHSKNNTFGSRDS